MRRACSGLLLAVALFAGCTTVEPRTKPSPDVPSAGRFPHERLGLFLGKVVSPDGLVDYAQADLAQDLLEEYLAELARVSPRSHPHLFPSERDQMAYWINAHNACAIRGVLHWQRPPRLSTIAHRFDSETKYVIGGRKLSLNDMREILVHEYAEPRAHFVVVSARRGGPPLSPEPFTLADVEQRLEAAARAFVGSERNVTVVPAAGEVRVSGLLIVYRADFERLVPAQVGGDARLVAALNRWRAPGSAIVATRVIPTALDDRLNDVANR